METNTGTRTIREMIHDYKIEASAANSYVDQAIENVSDAKILWNNVKGELSKYSFSGLDDILNITDFDTSSLENAKASINSEALTLNAKASNYRIRCVNFDEVNSERV